MIQLFKEYFPYDYFYIHVHVYMDTVIQYVHPQHTPCLYHTEDGMNCKQACQKLQGEMSNRLVLKHLLKQPYKLCLWCNFFSWEVFQGNAGQEINSTCSKVKLLLAEIHVILLSWLREEMSQDYKKQCVVF